MTINQLQLNYFSPLPKGGAVYTLVVNAIVPTTNRLKAMD